MYATVNFLILRRFSTSILSMIRVRPPAVAGLFYPDDAEELKQMVLGFLGSARASAHPLPRGIIAPHAGYRYSGPIAASAYAPFFGQDNGRYRRIVLLGPSHRVGFQGLALPEARAFQTPLGVVQIDGPAAEELLKLPGVIESDEAHAREHSLEVHLPFVQLLFPGARIVPVLTGRPAPGQVRQAIRTLLKDDGDLLVVSSDLSHYLSYEGAKARDRQTASTIESLRSEALSYEDACGRDAVVGLMDYMREAGGMRLSEVDLRNSGDTSGDRSRVVGYGAFHAVRN